jgi:hypothetical protein
VLGDTRRGRRSLGRVSSGVGNGRRGSRGSFIRWRSGCGERVVLWDVARIRRETKQTAREGKGATETHKSRSWRREEEEEEGEVSISDEARLWTTERGGMMAGC